VVFLIRQIGFPKEITLLILLYFGDEVTFLSSLKGFETNQKYFADSWDEVRRILYSCGDFLFCFVKFIFAPVTKTKEIHRVKITA
jgi:hypothetical protein